MAKGMFILEQFANLHSTPLFLSENTFAKTFPQDTTVKKSLSPVSPSVIQQAKPKIIGLNDTISIDQSRIDAIFKAAEERETKLSQSSVPKKKIIITDTTSFEGSLARIYSGFVPSFKSIPDYNSSELNDNFLTNIYEKTIHLNYKEDIKTSSQSSKTLKTYIPLKNKTEFGYEGKTRESNINGWYVLLALLSISIFAWGKSLYQKYLYQIVESLFNYQLANRLYRDKNILFRNLSIGLQILFSLNIGLFLYYLSIRYNLNNITNLPLANILIYSSGIFLFFQFKAALYKFIGYIFKVQDDFSEILHHVTIYNKALGLFLLPITLSIPFVNNYLQTGLLFFSLFIISALLLLVLFRGFQIVNKKHVSFFFLILYLCAVEILPVIILIKASDTII